MEFQTKLDSIEEVVTLVNKLERYNCSAEAWVGSKVVDARSFLGILGFGIGREIRIVIHSEMDESLKSKFEDFMIA